MKRVFRNVVVGIIALASTLFTVPAQAQSWGQSDNGRWEARAPQRTGYANNYTNNGRYGSQDYRGYSDRDRRGGHDYDRGYNNNYRYDDRYRESHNGRSAAIIGGSAAAGAVLGAAAGHGQGAVIGAIVGGVAGVIADQAVRHNDHRRR